MSRTMGHGHYRMKPLEVMTRNDADTIHTNSLDLLETLGIKVVSDEALGLLKAAGADVDEKTKVARIPSHLVMESVRKCKRPVRLCARNPKNDLLLDGKHCYISTDGTGLATIDLDAGVRRPSTKQDVADSAKVVDYLELMNITTPLSRPWTYQSTPILFMNSKLPSTTARSTLQAEPLT